LGLFRLGRVRVDGVEVVPGEEVSFGLACCHAVALESVWAGEEVVMAVELALRVWTLVRFRVCVCIWVWIWTLRSSMLFRMGCVIVLRTVPIQLVSQFGLSSGARCPGRSGFFSCLVWGCVFLVLRNDKSVEPGIGSVVSTTGTRRPSPPLIVRSYVGAAATAG
jgi:hypothetical protein